MAVIIKKTQFIKGNKPAHYGFINEMKIKQKIFIDISFYMKLFLLTIWL